VKKIIFYDYEKSFIEGINRYVIENEIKGIVYVFFVSLDEFIKYMELHGKSVDLVVCPDGYKERCSAYGNYKLLTLNYELITSEVSKLYSCSQVLSRINKEFLIANSEANKIFVFDPFFYLNKNKIINEIISSLNERVMILDFTIDTDKKDLSINRIFDLLYTIDWKWDDKKDNDEGNNELLKEIIRKKLVCEDGALTYYKICETKFDISTLEKDKAKSIVKYILNIDVDKIVIVSNCDTSNLFINFLKDVNVVKIFLRENDKNANSFKLSRKSYYEMINDTIKSEYMGDEL
jgi:hypothetical protein